MPLNFDITPGIIIIVIIPNNNACAVSAPWPHNRFLVIPRYMCIDPSQLNPHHTQSPVAPKRVLLMASHCLQQQRLPTATGSAIPVNDHRLRSHGGCEGWLQLRVVVHCYSATHTRTLWVVLLTWNVANVGRNCVRACIMPKIKVAAL